MSSHRLPIFDGLRGVAAVAVMAFHADFVFGIATPFRRGYLFVDFFFLLSGFVLTVSAGHKAGGQGASAAFMKTRLRRLWPMTVIGTLIGACAVGLMGMNEGVVLSLALALAMVPSLWGQGELFPLNGPQWSLFFELAANAVHVVILRRLTDRALRATVLVSGLMLVLTILLFGCNTLGPNAAHWQWAIPRVAFSYTLGVWFARKWMEGARTSTVPWILALLLPPASVIALPYMPLSLASGDTFATIVLLPVFFWLAACTTVPPRVEPWLSRMGALSFPLYAVHLPILRVAAYLDHSRGAMLLGMAVAILSAVFLERVTPALLAGVRFELGRTSLPPNRHNAC